MKVYLQRRQAHIVVDGSFSHNIVYVTIYQEFFFSENIKCFVGLHRRKPVITLSEEYTFFIVERIDQKERYRVTMKWLKPVTAILDCLEWVQSGSN